MKHGPCRLTRYRQVHETVMARYHADGFVEDDCAVIADLGSGTIEIVGPILCAGGTVIDVKKYLDISGDAATAVVQTRDYSYAAKLSGVGLVFRYCSPHFSRETNTGPEHHGYHHKHIYDPPDKNEMVSILGDDAWPTLGEVIGELQAWLWEHPELASAVHSSRG